MAKGMYIGVNDKARKVKKLYVGIADKARKVKKGYIGVGGVARPFYTSEQKPVYYGKATALSGNMIRLSSATIGNYALFGGGYNRSTNEMSHVVTAYNTSLTRSLPAALNTYADGGAATTVGSYAVFACGYKSTSSFNTTVNAYNSSLTRNSNTKLSTGRAYASAVSVGNYAIFAGGIRQADSDTFAIYNTVDAFNSSLTKSSPTKLSQDRHSLAGTTVGNYALFAGGTHVNVSTTYTTVDAYNGSLTRSTATALNIGGRGICATTLGKFAIFSINTSTTPNIYNESLTRTIGEAMSQGRYEMCAETIGNYALFAGGNISVNFSTANVDVYTLT